MMNFRGFLFYIANKGQTSENMDQATYETVTRRKLAEFLRGKQKWKQK